MDSNNMNNATTKEQSELCKKYGAEFVPSPAGWKIGISKNVKDGQMPINGLRHPPENGTAGWYIWAGREDINNDPDLWDAMHIEHLSDLGDLGSRVLKFLGLPPGWRFQIDNQGYEDVWQDDSLLNPQV